MTTETPLSNPNEQRGIPPAMSGAACGTTEEAEISLLDLMIVLAERKSTILWVTAVFAIAAVVVSLLLPKRYTATISLLPPQ